MKRIKYYGLPLLKVMLFGAFILICGIPFSLLQLVPFESFHPLIFEMFSELTLILMVLSGLLLSFRVFKPYHFASTFIGQHEIGSGFARGAIIGLLLVSSSAFLAWINGNVIFKLTEFNVLLVFGYLVLYLLVGIAEEFLFRTFPLKVLTERYPLWTGILITSLLFGFAHYFNPDFNWLAMLNITLVGACLAFYTLWKGNIYWAIGIHFGWNTAQGVLLGYQVSGTASFGVFEARPLGPIHLSGGNFGIESSVFCTIVSLALLIYLAIRYRPEPAIQANETTLIEENL